MRVFCRRVGQEDNKTLSDYQMNTIKQKSMEIKNQFDSLFYDVDCDSSDFKSESKAYVPRAYVNNNILVFIYTISRRSYGSHARS